jgi:dienelactone hydrolase
MRQLVIGMVAAAWLGDAGLAADVPKTDVVVTSRDGITLKGTYFSAGRPGFHVLTFDNRGAGDSQRGRETPATIAGDADAAYSWLAWQQGVDKSRIAAGGSSCGVGSAANLAAARPEIKALVLISGRAGRRRSTRGRR